MSERGLSFERAVEFDFVTAIYTLDTRRDDGELRYRALGLLNQRVHALVFVAIADGIRVISFRRANSREVQIYEQTTFHKA